MKIGIACSGLDHVRRGFETFARDLFRLIRFGTDLDVVLFKGNGVPSPREEVLWNVPRDAGIWGGRTSFIPWQGRYLTEQFTFALSLWRRLQTNPVDLVLFSDIQIGIVLRRLSRISHGPVLLFSNGGPFPAKDYLAFDFIQQLTPGAHYEALTQGVSPDKMALVPYTVDTDVFYPNPQAGYGFRKSIGIAADETVVLAVGAMESRQKRMDWLIREVSNLASKPHLVICGEYKADETETVKDLGQSLLGSRFHTFRLQHGEMPAVYNAADVFALCSLKEGFGRAFLESLSCGVPVVHHTDDDMNWIVGQGGLAVNMIDKGKLTSTLGMLIEDVNLRSRLSKEARSQAMTAFSEKQLLPKYTEMFERAISNSRRIVG